MIHKSLPNKKKIHRAWAMYDWANSAYNLVITSTIFPIYYVAITRNIQTEDHVSFFGINVLNSALLNYALAFAYLVIAFLSPILSSMADSKGNKKRYMQFFTILGAMACIGLYFFTKTKIELGICLSILAAIGYCGSLVFYNAYLPEIATKEEQDKLSAKGFAYGYIGCVLLQLICLIFVFKYEDWFGQTEDWGPRVSFLLVGLWWLGWSLIPFKVLPNNTVVPSLNSKAKSVVRGSFSALKKVWKQVQTMPKLKIYLAAFFFYSMGVQTVMLAAALFGSKEVKKLVDGEWVNMGAQDLIPAILIIQLVAILGAMLMARLSEKLGNFKVLMLNIFIWIIICCLAYYTRTNYEFYGIATLVGIVMGGIQSLSRSTYAKLIPQETHDNTSYFSFYDVMEKLSIVLGMFSFGFIEQITGNMRNAILALISFFIIGFLLLIFASKAKLQRSR
ncbi:MFS transporter [Taibaiella sp. KBW10]|uniref:MFS transporter n=1 Tax=Taibaiella sp. KBW10 TaxID=2153357 RepID=UPI000F5A91AD|nr:MFS transporter [Taibaiella sp. KBW10]RQO30004.1 MFS transporter [Taibaiella sp. KBW10]